MAADRVVSSKLFGADSRHDYPYGCGVVVTQGRHIFNDAALMLRLSESGMTRTTANVRGRY